MTRAPDCPWTRHSELRIVLNLQVVKFDSILLHEADNVLFKLKLFWRRCRIVSCSTDWSI